jgi:large conductance mechanosensitive channel
MLKDFRAFLSRGNVLELAVAVILGIAFSAIITSLVDDILMPVIGVLLGGVEFTSLSIQVGQASINYGNFIQAVVNFLIIAFVIFLIVRSAERIQKQKEVAPVEPSNEEKLLVQIRDLLELNLRR